jgi:pilus assembly protein TadC
MKKAKKTRNVPGNFVRTVLTVLAMLLIFAGPTYLMYILQRVGIPALLYSIVGLAAFIAGVILFFVLRHDKT